MVRPMSPLCGGRANITEPAFHTALPPRVYMRGATPSVATLSAESFEDGPAQRAQLVQLAEAALIARIDEMRRRLRLERTTDDLAKDIKATMHVQLPPYNYTVSLTLGDHERAKEFNRKAGDTFPSVRQEFGNAIGDFAVVREGRTAARKIRKMAKNAWKWDDAADRRIRNQARKGSNRSPYRGRPEKYDVWVVQAFADAIARAAGCKQFSTGRHGDATLTDKSKIGGAMFRVLVAAIQWARTMAWLTDAPWGTAPPNSKPEGILTVLKRGR
jgi:hypothetical protein